jgi:hypothetical protein
MNSKYIESGTLGFSAFSKSPVGTSVTYLLSTLPNANQEVSKSLKSACTKAGSVCTIKSTNILIEQEDGSWLPSHILTAEIKQIWKQA